MKFPAVILSRIKQSSNYLKYLDNGLLFDKIFLRNIETLSKANLKSQTLSQRRLKRCFFSKNKLGNFLKINFGLIQLSPCSGAAALSQTNTIHKNGHNFLFVFMYSFFARGFLEHNSSVAFPRNSFLLFWFNFAKFMKRYSQESYSTETAFFYKTNVLGSQEILQF